MCGICGFLGFEDKNLIKRMAESLSHRGPDDEGFYYGDNIYLGHRRLSIIDIEGGHQPVHNEDESIWIVYNGEIYNYVELALYLERCGHKFYTSSDTEVIVHAYEEFGENFVNKLVGIFSFAIWDDNRKTLLLARDRLGVKPLYYYLDDGKLIFASEIKSILQHKEFERQLNVSVLSHYLKYQSTPSNETILQKIKKLPSAHYLVANDADINIIKYWDLNPLPKDIRYDQAVQIKNFLESAVRKELVSDVPVGIFLSGGIDSSSVAAIASKYSENTLSTFSVGFGSENDELKFARETADYFGTNHHELIVDPNTISKILPHIVWHFDEPIADNAAIPVFLLSKLAKNYVSVVLTGEGADEIFAGYPKYKLFSPFFRMVPNALKRRMISFSPPSNVFADYEQDHHLLKCNNDINRNNKHNREKVSFDLNSQLVKDIKYWLPNYLLMKVDKMTMANGLEARVPFLDHVLVEECFRLPVKCKLNGLTGKYILRKMMSNTLPKNICNRPKRGFPMPLNKWVSNDLNDYITSTIHDSIFVNKNFDIRYINNLLNSCKSSYDPIKKFRCTRQAWLLSVFSIWHEMYIEKCSYNCPT